MASDFARVPDGDAYTGWPGSRFRLCLSLRRLVAICNTVVGLQHSMYGLLLLERVTRHAALAMSSTCG